MSKEAINLIEKEYPEHFIVPLHTRKLKLKDSSFKGVSGAWKEFRLNRLRKKLETEKNKLVSMEFSADKLNNESSLEKTENKVLARSRAIANLESKINFLETGSYLSPQLVDSRAIKLKENMMSNMRCNSNAVYSVPENVAKKITADIDWKQIESQIGANVQKIMEEEKTEKDIKVEPTKPEPLPVIVPEPKAAVPKVENDKTPSEEIPAPTIKREEIASAINSELEPKERVSQSDVRGAIDEEFAKVTVDKPLDQEDVKIALDEEIDKVVVTPPEQKVMRVNPYINEDGTYSLSRDDMDESFRITKIDREELETPIIKQEIISPFEGAPKRDVPYVEEPRKAIEGLNEITIPSFESKNSVGIIGEDEFRKEIGEDEEEPQIFSDEDDTIFEEMQPQDERLTDLMDKVKLLKAERERLTAQQESALRAAAEVNRKYTETFSELESYAQQLEQQCTDIHHEVADTERTTSEKEAYIHAVVELLSDGSSTDLQAEKETPGRTK